MVFRLQIKLSKYNKSNTADKMSAETDEVSKFLKEYTYYVKLLTNLDYFNRICKIGDQIIIKLGNEAR